VLFYLGQSPAGTAPAGVRLYNDIFLTAALSKKKHRCSQRKRRKKKEKEKKKAIKISCCYIKLY
jgi:hypothetical protein